MSLPLEEIRRDPARGRHARRVLPRRLAPARVPRDAATASRSSRSRSCRACSTSCACSSSSWPGRAPAPPTPRRCRASPRCAATQAHLSELYSELVAPLRSRLDAAHLIFVPHDLLHYVPFHALHDGQRHLIDSFSISYAPSATIYALCQRRAPTTGRILAGPRRARRADAVHPRRSSARWRRAFRARSCTSGAEATVARPAREGRRAALPPHRRPRLLPARQPDVLRDPARRLVPHALRPLQPEAARGAGHAQRLRHRPQRDRGRRRAARAGARPVPRGGGVAAADAVGGARTRAPPSS